ncbi:MAG: hypothetical protein KA774_09870 [Burkholderiaceae bacterium]|nr:hypothetical protein [Burkholderiaceae bacterium]
MSNLQLGQLGRTMGSSAASLGTVWNSAEKNAAWTLSSGDTVATLSSAVSASVNGTNPHSSGKWYFEVLVGGTPDTGFPHSPSIGVCSPNEGSPTFVELGGGDASQWAYLRDGQKRFNGGLSAYGSSYGATDVVMVALDLDNGKIWFGKNGTWQASGDPAAGTNQAYSSVSGPLVPTMTANTGSPAGTLRASSATCSYSPPSGFDHW